MFLSRAQLFLITGIVSNILFLLSMIIVPDIAYTTPIPTLSSKTIVDSQEPYNCRVYSYDMAIDSKGDVHIVYSQPNSGCTKADIYYIRRTASTWQTPILISNNGSRPSISTFILIDNSDRVHICYVQDGATKTLHYITANNGIIGVDRVVADGGWHTRMQLDENNYPIFVREGLTWPGLETKLVLFRTTDGANWDKKELNLPTVAQFRVADFIYDNGKYHITYGDSAFLKEVWSTKYQTERIDEIFHNLHYTVFTDADATLASTTIDSSVTLHNRQFWTSLVLDSGVPLASMYKYNEYGGRFNYGTSANLMKNNGSSWTNRLVTNSDYPDTLEGMGPGLVVNGPNDYFCAWDFSPDDTHNDDFRGKDGNLALARSGPKNDWTPKVQLDPFSLEGRAILHIHQGRLFFLGLGNWRDAKLYFREYSIAELNKVLPGAGSQASQGSGGLPPMFHLLLQK